MSTYRKTYHIHDGFPFDPLQPNFHYVAKFECFLLKLNASYLNLKAFDAWYLEVVEERANSEIQNDSAPFHVVL